MFRAMRRADRQVSEARALEILARAEYGTLATAGEGGYPYAVPLCHVVMDGNIYFHCAQQGAKLDHIAANPNVCYSAVADVRQLPEKFSTVYESAVVFGTAQVVAEGDEKNAALMALCRKYAPGREANAAAYVEKSAGETAVVRIVPAHVTGKARS